MSNFLFTLYTVEFKSDSANLLEIAENFSTDAEIDYFDGKSRKVKLWFISTADPDHVIKMCDDYKKEVESGGGVHLIYKIENTEL